MAIVFSSSGILTTILPRCAATSTSPASDQEDDAQQPFKLTPLKRRERWQWSKGDAPGEFGGPPLDFRIRRMGVKPAQDPLSSRDDYIWKKEWQSFVAEPSKDPPSPPALPESDAGVGFLSLNRAIALESIDIDLSKELSKPVKSVLELQVKALRDGFPTDKATKQDKPRWRMAPTGREQKQWERARKYTGMSMLVSKGGEAQETPKVRSASARQDYLSLKNKLQLLTAVLGGVGAAVAYVSYSPEVAISYGIGLLGALAYIRMLGNTVDSFGKSDAKGAIRGALGQQRLLVPVVLVMFFNRWNEVLAPTYGFTHLQLFPILIGFFTYKAATLAEAFSDILQGSGGENL